MKKFKKVCLLMVVIFLLGVTVVNASTITIDPSGTTIGGDSNTTPKTNTIPTTPTTGNTSNYKNTTNTTNLPKTGADDYLIISVVAVLGIAGVYAFKKIRDYKDI